MSEEDEISHFMNQHLSQFDFIIEFYLKCFANLELSEESQSLELMHHN